MTKVILGKDLFIQDPTKEMRDFCDRNFIIKNPEYHKTRSMGFYVGHIPQTLQLFSRDGTFGLRLPFGAWRSFMKKFHGQYEAATDFPELRQFDYKSSIKLYPYQERISEKIVKYKNGIAVMPCGSGKTQTALDAIAKIGGRTLWLTHTKDLLSQSKKRAEQCYDCDHKSFGTITEGKVNIGDSITFATVQTMAHIDLTDLRYAFDVIVIDECQHVAGSPTKCTMFYKVLSQLSARYKIGLTATPRRADHLEVAMFAMIGEIIGTVSQEEIADRTCPVEVRTVHTDYEPLFNSSAFRADGTIDYNGLIDDLTSNEPRFDLVLRYVNRCKGPRLVLGNRVEYLKRLQEQFCGRSVCLSGMKPTVKNKRERDTALTRLNDGELDCVFATYALAKEGIDVPNLRTVIFATPEKDFTTVVQSVGRVARKAEGKEKGIVIDFVDSDFGMYKKYAATRRNIYKKLGYNIKGQSS